MQQLLALCGEHTEADEGTAWKVGSATRPDQTRSGGEDSGAVLPDA